MGQYEINTPNPYSIMQANALYAYCGNNPCVYIDSTGQAWYHWALGAAIVAVAAVAVVATAGGAAAAVTAVALVSSGTAAATTASTVAAGAFIGSSAVYGISVVSAAAESSSLDEFAEKGDWGTVAATATGAAYGGYIGYKYADSAKKQTNNTNINTNTNNNSTKNTKYNATESNLTFSDKFLKSEYKNQVAERGWTNESIINTINTPVKTEVSTNYYTNNSATLYFCDDIHYVAVDDVTQKVIQVADLNDKTWSYTNYIK